MKIVKVDKNQNIETISLKNKTINLDLLQDLLENKRNKKDLKLLYTFNFLDNESVDLYGYKNGKEKNINKLELPDEIENEIYYDDLIFCSRINKKYINFDSNDFKDFYNSIFDGFEIIENTDEEFQQDDDYDYEDGFVI